MASGQRPPSLPLAAKMVRFGMVGIANSLIDVSIFTLAWKFLAFPPLAANLLGWLAAVSFSYAANSRWSFERSTELGERRAVTRFFVLGALITLGVSSGALVALTPFAGTLGAKITGLIVAAVINFAAARWAIEDRIL